MLCGVEPSPDERRAEIGPGDVRHDTTRHLLLSHVDVLYIEANKDLQRRCFHGLRFSASRLSLVHPAGYSSIYADILTERASLRLEWRTKRGLSGAWVVTGLG